MSRLRLTIAFALAVALVLVAAGVLLYVRVRSTLDEQVAESLRARTGELAERFDTGGTPPSQLGGGSEESFAQAIERRTGRIIAASDGLANVTLLTRSQLNEAAGRAIVFDRGRVPGVDGDDVRIRAAPATRVIVLAGVSLDDRNEALGSLRTQLLLVGPLALLAALAAGYGLAAATLRPVVARLREGIARERRFVAEASHELRTPLSSLKTELELALRRPRSSDELRAALRSAAEETDRLAVLAEELLVLARADEGGLRLERERMSARGLLDAVARRFAARAEQRGRAVTVDAPDDLELHADRLLVEQALGNLVDNALRHGDGAISLTASRRGGDVELRVADAGEGFSEEMLVRAFERFSGTVGRGGAGLGLALVEAIVRAHGGTVAARNRAGGGAEVVVAFPG